MDGNYVFMGNLSLLLNFDAAAGAVQEVCFDFTDGGGDENFAVNGSPVVITQAFSEIADLDIPGVTISLTTVGSSLESGTVCISGNIESLLLGGQEFGVDNVCFGTITNCGILNLEAEVVECYGDSIFDVLVDFDHLSTNPNVSGFDVLVNGEEVGAFIPAGANLPYFLNFGVAALGDSGFGTLTIEPDVGTNNNLPFSTALFGPQVPNVGLNGLLVEAFDASTEPTMICEDIVNVNQVNGSIALVDRGACTFQSKTLNAQAAGAIGLIICNFEDELIDMAGVDLEDPEIPTVMLKQSDCAYLRQLLESQDVFVNLSPEVSSFTLTVCENDNPDCCASIEVDATCEDEPTDDCISFDEFDEGVYGSSTGIQPGTTIYTENDVSVFLVPFQSLFWTTTYGDLQVISTSGNPEMTTAGGNYLQFESVNAAFNLTAYPDPIDSITLDFYYTGGGINIAANGAAFLIQNTLTQGIYPLAPGVILEVVFTPGSLTEGQLLFSGNLQTILVGGEGDFRVDNLCINPTPQECSIENLTLTATPCNPNNVFEVVLDFDYSGTSDSFKLVLNNILNSQYYAYADLPITIGPLVGPFPETVVEIVDANDPMCSASVILPAVDCEDCTLEQVFVLEVPTCIEDGQLYQASLEVFEAEPGDLLVVTSATTGTTESYIYNGSFLEVVFPYTNMGYDDLLICNLQDATTPTDCCLSISFDIACPTCTITDLVLEPQDCNDDGYYYFDVDFNVTGTFSDSFLLTLSNGYEAWFSYLDLPVTLGPVLGNGENHFVWLFDEFQECGINANLQSPDCEDGCILGEVSLFADPGCNDDGTYNVPLVIENAQVGDLLVVYSEVTGYVDTIAYGTLNAPILQLSNWPVSNDQYDLLIICLPDGTGCCVEIDFDVPCDGGCPTNWVDYIDFPSCDNTNPDTYYASFVLDVPSGTLVGITSTISGEFITEIYNGEAVDINFSNINGFDELEVCFLDNNSDEPCCTSIAFDIDCDDCGLGEISRGPWLSCLSDGTYYTFINVENSNNGDMYQVTSQLSGQVDTFYGYSIGFYLDDMPFPSGTQDELLICSGADFACCQTIFIDVTCSDSCLIGEIIVEDFECNDDGTYNMGLTFEDFESGDVIIASSLVTNFSDTLVYGGSSVTDSTLNLEGWPVPLEAVFDSLQFCFANDPECCIYFTNNYYPSLLCDPVPCNLQPVIEIEECYPNGVLHLNVGLFGEPANGNLYTVHINGQSYGAFALNYMSDLGLVLNDTGLDEWDIVFTTFSNSTGNQCTITETLDVSECYSDCEIPGLDAFTLGCSDFNFGAYEVQLSFNTDSLEGETLDIYVNGDLYLQNVAPVTLGIEVFPLNSGNSLDIITVCYNDDPDCCESIEVFPLDCFCNEIVEIIATPYPCNADGFYEVEFNLEYIGFEGNTFDLYIDGQYSDTYLYEELPIEVGPFAGNGEDHLFEVYPGGQCNPATALITGVNCEDNCVLPFLEYAFVDCNPGEIPVLNMVLLIEPQYVGTEYVLEIPGYFGQQITMEETYLELSIPLDWPNIPPPVLDMIICSTNTPNCCETYTIDVDCGPFCDLTASIFEDSIVCGANAYYAVLEIDGLGVGDSVLVTSLTTGSFTSGEVNNQNVAYIPLEFIIPANGIDILEICSADEPNCCINYTIDACPPGCAIVEAGWDVECANDGTFEFTLEFIETTNSALTTIYELTLFGYGSISFTLTDLPLTVGPYTPTSNTGNVEFVIESAFCEPYEDNFQVDCVPTGCVFTNVITEAYGCDDGYFMVDVEVDVNEPGVLGYFIFVDGQIFGPFSYNEPYVTIGPFPGDGETLYDILLLDIEDPSCFGYTEVEALDCSSQFCDITDLTITPLDCLDDGTYGITIDFNVSNPGNSYFEVFNGNGAPLGFYLISALPVTIQGISPTASGFNEIKVCINDNPYCCASQMIMQPQCPSDCEISDIDLVFAYCNDDGFWVELTFNVEDPGPGGYKVLGNGQTYGTYSYNEPFPIIGPFDPFTDNIYELIIMDLGNPDCMNFIEFPAFDCVDECEITALTGATDCNPDGSYDIILNVEVNNPGNDYVDIFTANGIFLGFYPISEDIVISNLVEDIDLIVCINDNPDCCETISFAAPDCNEDCIISDVNAAFAFCDSVGNFYVQLGFEVENTDSDQYTVVGNGVTYGLYSYSNPFPIIGPFASDPNAVYELVVIDAENNECSDFVVFPSYPCTDDCQIVGLTGTTTGCDANGTYTAVLAIDVINPLSDTVIVYNNSGEIIGAYELNNTGIIEINGLTPSADGVLDLIVCVDDPFVDCCESISLTEPDCNENCEIYDVEVEFAYCDTLGFYVYVFFNVENPVSDNYVIFGNGVTYGEFSYVTPVIPVVGPFSPDTDNVYELIVADSEDNDCKGSTDFVAFDCDGEPVVNCIALEEIDIQTFSGADGYEDGDILFEFPEVTARFETLEESCTDCSVDIEDADDYTFFPIAEGNVLKLDGAGVEFDFGSTNGLSRKVTLNFDYLTDSIIVKVNGLDYEEVAINNVYHQLNDGVTMTSTFGVFESYGIITFIGNIELLSIYAPGAFVVDNICVTDFEDNPSCIEFIAFDNVFGDTLIRLDEVEETGAFWEEDGVIITSSEDSWINYPFPIDDIYGVNNTEGICGFEAEGGAIVISGKVDFDFTDLEEIPNELSFDMQFCPWSSTVQNQIKLEIGPELFEGTTDDFPTMIGGVLVNAEPVNNAGQWRFYLAGDVEMLGISTIIAVMDNLCFDRVELTDNCVGFDIFDELNDTIFLADYGQFYEFYYEEDGVILTSPYNEDIPFGGVMATDPTVNPVSNCSFETTGGAIFVLNGILNVDFTNVEPVGFVSFEYAPCSSSEAVYLTVNGEEYLGFIDDMPSVLGGVELTFQFDQQEWEWAVVLAGQVETFSIAAGNFYIDNICFDEQMAVEEVWPGDANADNIAHHIDLLNVGIAYGAVGPERFEDGNVWDGLDAMLWSDEFANGVNYKHADCNGDGIIDESDRQAIIQNYGLTHGEVGDFVELPFTDLDPPVYVDIDNQIPSGTAFNVPIIVGTEEQPVEDIYGLAFTVSFDPSLIEGESIEIIYPTSWFGEPNVNTLTIDRTYESEGLIEVALTRIDKNNVSGYGPIAYIIGITDNIAGLEIDSEVEIIRVKALDKEEEQVKLGQRSTSFTIIGKEDGNVGDEMNGIFSLYPNPTSDWVSVVSRHGFEPEVMTLVDMNGKIIDVPQDSNRVSLESVPAGTYILRIKSGKTQVHKFIVRQ